MSGFPRLLLVLAADSAQRECTHVRQFSQIRIHRLVRVASADTRHMGQRCFNHTTSWGRGSSDGSREFGVLGAAPGVAGVR